MNLYHAVNDNSVLIAHLDASLSHRLMLITGPGGCGKTTLLLRWIELRRVRAAWVKLQLDDNTPEYWLASLTAALRAVGLDVQTRFAGELLDNMIDLINALASVPNILVVILDNYHLIDSTCIHTAVQLLLDYMPLQIHIVIASRVEPPLELARLRVRRQMVDITLLPDAP